MAINFPSSPSTNDTYSYGGKTWRFNGVAWEIYSSGNIGNITVTGNVTAGNILTDNYFYANGSPFTSYTDTDVLSYLGNVSGNINPSTNVTYTLGNSTNQWHSLYVGPGSLYVNNKKVIEDSSGKITVSTSVNQNLAITTSGTGDIELFPNGTGVINLQGNVQADSGVIVSGTGGLKFGSNLNLDNNNINNLDDPVQAQDAATKAYVDAEVASAQGNYSDSNVASYLPTYTGNLTAGNITVTGTIDGYATTTYVGTEIANLVNSAPSTLDTLNELATALGNDAAFSTTITSLIGNNTSNIATIQSQITALEANTHANLESNVTTLESQITNLNYYDDANVTTFLSDIGSNNIVTTGNVTAGYFIGNGSQLTGLPAGYADSNVADYLPTYTGNITAGNILTDNYFYANGDAFVSGGSSGVTVTVSNTAPTSPSSGDIWVDSDTGREYTYLNDGDSSQFIEFGTPSIDIGTNKTTLPIFNFPTNIDSNLTIESGFNGLSVGPITQANNTVISINAGQRWIIL